MKKIFIMLLLVLVAGKTLAYDVEIDGIYYNLKTAENEAEVSQRFNQVDEAGARNRLKDGIITKNHLRNTNGR